MSEPIKVGDLVMVLRTHCRSREEGAVMTVTNLAFPKTGTCWGCGKELIACAAELDGAGWNPLQWLRRIPPLDELERDQIVKELTA